LSSFSLAADSRGFSGIAKDPTFAKNTKGLGALRFWASRTITLPFRAERRFAAESRDLAGCGKTHPRVETCQSFVWGHEFVQSCRKSLKITIPCCRRRAQWSGAHPV